MVDSDRTACGSISCRIGEVKCFIEKHSKVLHYPECFKKTLATTVISK